MVLSPLADGAISLLRDTVRDYEAVAIRPSPKGRILPAKSALAPIDFDNARGLSYLFRCAAIAEAYVDAALQMMFDDALAGTSPVARQLLEEHMDGATRTWSSRVSSYKGHHSIMLTSFEGWDELNGLIEARNSFAHGLGTLTRLQAAKALRTAQRLALIGVNLEAGQLMVNRSALNRGASVAERLVRWLDDETSP